MEWYFQLLAAVILHGMFGALTYSPAMFGDQFLKHAHPKKTYNDLAKVPQGPGIALAQIGGLVSLSILQRTIAHLDFVQGWDGGVAAGVVAAVLSAGLNAPHHYFELRSYNLYVIHNTYHLMSMCAGGAIFGYFKE